MYRPADPATRREFITGLRDLADYLAAHPGLPVPVYGRQIIVPLNPYDEGGSFQVRKYARLLGVPVTDEAATGGNCYAEKPFGSVIYKLVAIPDDSMARYHALTSYDGCVDPE